MEILFALAVLGGGAYWFFRGNIRRGAEIMRANIFLTALERGHSKAEANDYASRDMAEVPVGFIQMANARAHRSYGGVRLAMVGDAYRVGMHPRLPPWERGSVIAAFNGTIGGQRNSSPPTSRTAQPFPGTYAEYYADYISELKNLSGLAPSDFHQAELMEEIGEATGDSLTRKNLARGVDPKEYAAAVHAVMQRNQPTSEFASFDSYFAAYIAELKHLAGTKPDQIHPAELMVRDGVKSAYDDGVPPQVLASLVHDREINGRQV